MCVVCSNPGKIRNMVVVANGVKVFVAEKYSDTTCTRIIQPKAFISTNFIKMVVLQVVLYQAVIKFKKLNHFNLFDFIIVAAYLTYKFIFCRSDISHCGIAGKWELKTYKMTLDVAYDVYYISFH